MPTPLILVCDDAGFESVDRGIRALVESTGKPVSAEYMIEQHGAAERARAISDLSLVSRGLHFELMHLSDAERFQIAKDLQKKGSSLGNQRDIRDAATHDARRQLRLFRETQGIQPAHISTHGNFNTDAHGQVLPWWTDLMDEMFDGDIPPMQLAIPYVRHNLYSWNTPDSRRDPRTPEEFSRELERNRQQPAVEFVMHPAKPETGDASLNMLFTAKMREMDLESAIRIIRSGIIERTGFEIVPVNALRTASHEDWQQVA